MSQALPFIDEHALAMKAPPERVWTALLARLRSGPARVPGLLAAAWGLRHVERSGGWEGTPAVGDTLPGFRVAEVAPPRQLTLRGGHRFAEYEIRFAIEELPSGLSQLRAATYAVFPGLLGRLYRIVVISTGGHALVVRRMLAGVAGKV